METDEITKLLPYTPHRTSRWPDPTMNFIIAYDIADPKRLKQVATSLERTSRRVQKSLFIFNGSRKELNSIITDLVALIDITEDRVQAWPIRTSTKACRVDAGCIVPDTGLALVIADDHWMMIESVDDLTSHEPLIID